jgi:hypothetical protein
LHIDPDEIRPHGLAQVPASKRRFSGAGSSINAHLANGR